MILHHYIRFAADGFLCTCGHIETIGDGVADIAKRKAAGRHQLVVFLHHAKESDDIATNCLACGEKIMASPRSEDRLAEYNEWIHRPCDKCHTTPVDAVSAVVQS